MAKTVIVADDRSSWREMYVDAIKRGFAEVKVEEVETGADLVERVLQGNYAVIISDNDMEKKGAGLAALQKIRESGNNVPFYLLSGGDVSEEIALSSGVTCFYKKEKFDSDQLITDLKQYLG